MDVAESLAHVQVPRGLRAEVPPQGAVRGAEEAPGVGLPGPRQAEGVQDRGRAPDERSRAYVDLDPAEVRGGAGDRIPQGQDAIHIARTYLGKRQNFVGQHFWAREYFVSTVASSGVDR